MSQPTEGTSQTDPLALLVSERAVKAAKQDMQVGLGLVNPPGIGLMKARMNRALATRETQRRIF